MPLSDIVETAKRPVSGTDGRRLHLEAYFHVRMDDLTDLFVVHLWTQTHVRMDALLRGFTFARGAVRPSISAQNGPNVNLRVRGSQYRNRQ